MPDCVKETSSLGELIREWENDCFRLLLFDTGEIDSDGKSILGYQLFDSEHGDEPMFQGTDFHCSPLHAIDSDRVVASLLGFLSLRPGDTDREHFEGYTKRQLEWCQQRGEELSLLAYELERPYRPLHGTEIGHETWEEAGHAGRFNRALTLSYAIDGTTYRVTLHAGEDDAIEILTDGGLVYVLTSNSGLGYAGLEAFDGSEAAGEAFLESWEVDERLGDQFWDLGPAEQLERLIPYLSDPPPAPLQADEECVTAFQGDHSPEMRARLATFLRLGQENPWLQDAIDPPFNERSFHVCEDEEELVERILQGGWCLGQAFVLGDICFINQVDGGDEWLTIKGSVAFESITMQTFNETREAAADRLRGTVGRIQQATEEQCRNLEY